MMDSTRGIECHCLRKGCALDQSHALHDAQAAAREPVVTADGAHDWESELPDLATLSLAALDGLPPLGGDSRVLAEVLRARDSVKGGGEPQGRAE